MTAPALFYFAVRVALPTIRKAANGSGHGRSAKFNGLTKRQAELSVGASIILVRYSWDTFLLINENK